MCGVTSTARLAEVHGCIERLERKLRIMQDSCPSKKFLKVNGDQMHRNRKTGDQGGRRAKLCRQRRSDRLIDKLVAEHGKDQQSLLPILRGIADGGASFDDQRLGATADAIGSHDAQVASVASFYSMLSSDQRLGTPIRVCDGPACMLNDACQLRSELDAAVRGRSDWIVKRSSCLGLCDRAPAVLVGSEACGPLVSGQIPALINGWRGDRAKYDEPLDGEVRVAMARVGRLDPESYASAVQMGAYEMLGRALTMSPEAILHEVELSGLRGCGGAGFPTGRKWRMVAEKSSPTKYLICNADESEPGAFKDRVLMENDPHLVVEGMALAAYAVGATEGIVYVRGEYEHSARMLERAIDEANHAGWLGECIHGSPFSFDVRVHRGAGAYICGEETALLESLEGRRGEPRLRPPYPAEAGHLSQPTVVNNVETLCRVPAICTHGSEWYQNLGPPDTPGTKMFTLTGQVRRPGAFETPLGITTRDIIHRFGMGLRSESEFKMALTGGAAGTLVPEALLDERIDFYSEQRGVALGSGVLIVFDTSTSAVDLLKWLLHFFRQESCGKCTPCREGSHLAYEIVTRIAGADGHAGDLGRLRHLANMLERTSFCGLGQSIAMPVLSAIDYFPEDFRRCGAS